jgi:hypothetical protein
MTQALSPSSYVTGYGVGTSDFGWYFGSVLGDNKVSPGVRKTYVLVALNGECLQANHLFVVQASLAWTKGLQSSPQGIEEASWSFPVTEDTMQLKRMEYAPVAYRAPTTLVPSAAQPVTVLMTFDKRVDQAIAISANGVNLYRVRDNFAPRHTAGHWPNQLWDAGVSVSYCGNLDLGG